MIEIGCCARLLGVVIAYPFVDSNPVPRIPAEVDRARCVLAHYLMTSGRHRRKSPDVRQVSRLDAEGYVMRLLFRAFAGQLDLMIVHVVAGARSVGVDFLSARSELDVITLEWLKPAGVADEGGEV